MSANGSGPSAAERAALGDRVAKLHAEHAARSQFERMLFDLSCLSTVDGYVRSQLRLIARDVGVMEREHAAAILAASEQTLRERVGELEQSLREERRLYSQQVVDALDLRARLAVADRVVEAARPLAESAPFAKAAAMEDPGRVPCFINTEGAQALLSALVLYDAAAITAQQTGEGEK